MKAKHYILIASALTVTVILLSARKTVLLPEEAEKIVELDQKIDSAVAFVESGEQPMKGIMMLREVLEEDSTNIKALTRLGQFSIQSGQYDKAEERFETIKKLEAQNIDALYYLGHLSARKGNKDEALSYFSKCLELTDDKEFSKELNEYIKELQNN